MEIPYLQHTFGTLCTILLLIVPSSSYQHEGGFVRDVSQNYDERLNSQLEQQIMSFHNQELAYRAYAAFYDRSDVDLPGFRKFFTDLAQKVHQRALLMTDHVNRRGGRVRFPVLQMKDACSYIEKVHGLLEITSRTKPHICYFASLTPDPYKTQKKKKGASSKSFWYDFKKKDTSKPEEESKKWLSVSGMYGLEDALAMEKSINEGLLKLVEVATQRHDPHTRHHLEIYLEDQVSTIKKVADLVTKLRQYTPEADYPLGEYLLDRELDA